MLFHLRSAMNEGDGPESKLQWWFDWDNDVVCVICPPHAVHCSQLVQGVSRSVD